MNAIKKACLLSVGLLTACATPKPAGEPPVNVTMPRAERELKTSAIHSFTISGAIAARNKAKSFTASLNWRQQSLSNYNIRLSGPLGGGTVIIERDGGEVSYKDGPKVIHAANADQLLEKQAGIRLPVNNLYYWVRGMAAPGPVASSKFDKYNHLTSLQQGGYSIEYGGYTAVKNTDLPNKIILKGRGVFIKLIIKHWSV